MDVATGRLCCGGARQTVKFPKDVTIMRQPRIGLCPAHVIGDGSDGVERVYGIVG